MNRSIIKISLLAWCSMAIHIAAAQDNKHTVTSAVPFLRISADVRSSGMGDAGIATSADAYAAYRNLAKAPFATSRTGFAASFTPWMGDVSEGIYLAGVTGYHKLGNNQAIAASLRYFNLGKAQLTDESGNHIGTASPREFAVDAGYSRKLSDEFSLAVAARYIYSRLASGNYNGMDYSAGNAVAGDLSLYYRHTRSNNDIVAAGLVLSNLGTKINYTSDADATNFLPANIGAGFSYTFSLEDGSSIMLQAEANKLMVPTAPQDPDALNAYRSTAVTSSWFNSFEKANGGFRTAQVSVGAEAIIKKIVGIRAGYAIDGRYRNNDGDSRGAMTYGASLTYKAFGFDFSYLSAPRIGVAGNPAANTFRFGVTFGIQ